MRRRLITLVLTPIACIFGADNVLTKQEKAQGWILLFDGKTLNGWDSAATAAPGRGRGMRQAFVAVIAASLCVPLALARGGSHSTYSTGGHSNAVPGVPRDSHGKIEVASTVRRYP